MEVNMNLKVKAIVATVFCLLSLPAVCIAAGGDMWSEMFAQQGLFIPHRDFCDSSTEVFVAIGETANRGFCIEKSERTATTWVEARQDCSEDGKRLPEVAEFQYACNNATGLSDMTDDREFASNFPSVLNFSTGTGGTVVPVVGNGGCDRGTWSFVAWGTSPYIESNAYRCVR